MKFHKKETAGQGYKLCLRASGPSYSPMRINAHRYIHFYTGKFAHTLDNMSYRKTQYDLWDFEERLPRQGSLYVPPLFADRL